MWLLETTVALMWNTVVQPKKSDDSSKRRDIVNDGNLKTNMETLNTLKNDPQGIRSFQNFISNCNPATLASLNTGQTRDVPPDMIRTASNMISKMSPEELQKILGTASSFQGDNPFLRGGSPDSLLNPGSIPSNVTPDMIKTASDMISNMSPDDLQKMFEMASSLKGKESIPSSAAVDTNVSNVSRSNFPSSSADGTDAFGESSSSQNVFSNMRNASRSNFPSSSIDLQEQMKDPAMRQMLWADRIQRGVEGVKKTKYWLLGKPGMFLAICMLILAVIVHRLGFIGG